MDLRVVPDAGQVLGLLLLPEGEQVMVALASAWDAGKRAEKVKRNSMEELNLQLDACCFMRVAKDLMQMHGG